MRFIGSKQKLLPFIRGVFENHVKKNGKPLVAGDLFCGTAVVSGLMKELNYIVIANDNLRLGYVLAQAMLSIDAEPTFERLLAEDDSSDKELLPYDRVLEILNRLPGNDGFFSRQYSPHDQVPEKSHRLYFTTDNARKIDAMRTKLGSWEADSLVTESELCLLKADLMRATNRIANISGTYGYFNRTWDTRSKNILRLIRSPISAGISGHTVHCEDANHLAQRATFDLVYLDPPYTWRHYGAYYHILETIAVGDEPPLAGRSGLRPWESTRSPYCEPKNAASALSALIDSLDARHIFLSYNSEGLVSHDHILDAFSRRGEPISHEIGYRRYLSNSGGSRNKVVTERLYYVKTR